MEVQAWYKVVPGVSRLKWIEPGTWCTSAIAGTRLQRRTPARLLQRHRIREFGERLGHLEHIPPRDAEALRRISKIERAFAGCWSVRIGAPHPVLQTNVFASKWPAEATLWTVVNRNPYRLSDARSKCRRAGRRYSTFGAAWNCGEEAGGRVGLSFELNVRLRAILETRSPMRPDWAPRRHARAFRARLASSRQTGRPASRSYRSQDGVVAPPEGMMLIPAVQDFVFRVSGIEREATTRTESTCSTPGELAPPSTITSCLSRHSISILPCHQCALPGSWRHALPAEDGHNFLKTERWKIPGAGEPARHLGRLEDARATHWQQAAAHEWSGSMRPGNDGDLSWGND